MTDKLKLYSIKDLFRRGSYIIPSYQRNYAWGEREIVQLIEDINDFANMPEKKQVNYHIGTLVVYQRSQDESIAYETIDGQQRLTTLNILLNVLKHEFKREVGENILKGGASLAFDSRPKSTLSMKRLHNNGLSQTWNEDELNTNIIEAYHICTRTLKAKLGQDLEKVKNFCNYLGNYVKILRVPVPPDTDLNHYFEIMNNRGEQLEKHEVLKARFLKVFENDPVATYSFSLMWDACTDMERYLQYGFKKAQREALFKQNDWNTFLPKSFDDLSELLYTLRGNLEDSVEKTLEDIIKQTTAGNTKVDDMIEGSPERFSSVIGFPNFLLHVLRVYTGADIALDDKQLLTKFDVYLKQDNCENIQFAKEFGYALLKARFLFDQYIIKRNNTEKGVGWSLQRLKYYESGSKGDYVTTFGDEESGTTLNRQVTMLLAMFHVSAPTQIYKHWLNAALKFLYETSEVNAKDYLEFLERLSQVFAFNIYLTQKPKTFYDVIYKAEGLNLDLIYDESMLDRGTAVENFVFNYLDYLIWKQGEVGLENFEFTFRSSVEHYYPQNPKLAEDKMGDDVILNSIGNLCLISASKNSSLSNNMPEVKKTHYNKVQCDSIKQRLMLNYPGQWDKKAILEHGNEMKKVLRLSYQQLYQ